jgi:hypothetical protein
MEEMTLSCERAEVEEEEGVEEGWNGCGEEAGLAASQAARVSWSTGQPSVEGPDAGAEDEADGEEEARLPMDWGARAAAAVELEAGAFDSDDHKPKTTMMLVPTRIRDEYKVDTRHPAPHIRLLAMSCNGDWPKSAQRTRGLMPLHRRFDDFHLAFPTSNPRIHPV